MEKKQSRIKTKKLSKRHFRYITDQVIENPMIYIHDFFNNRISIDAWIGNIDLMINEGVYSGISYTGVLGNGFECKQLIEQVEVAYVIFKQCGLKRQSSPISFFKTREDYFNYSNFRKYTLNGKASPADTLSKFFSYQSLSGWYDTLDELMGYLTYKENNNYERFGDKIVVIKDLLLRLGHAIYDIHENNGISVDVPSYFIACPAEPHEGKIPKSN